MTPFEWLVNYIVHLMIVGNDALVSFYARFFPAFYNAALAIYNSLPS